jgi:hypothetical protein
MQAVSRVGEVPLAEREGVPQLWQVPRIGSTEADVRLERPRTTGEVPLWGLPGGISRLEMQAAAEDIDNHPL